MSPATLDLNPERLKNEKAHLGGDSQLATQGTALHLCRHTGGLLLIGTLIFFILRLM